MIYPILYSKWESSFSSNGIGVLTDCVSCYVTEELNGEYEAEFQYPINGVYYSQIIEGCFIKCKPNDTAEPQIFKIYRSTKPIRGVVKFYCEHISYQLNGYPIDSISRSASLNGLLQGILSASLVSHNFTGRSYKNTTGKIDLKAVSVRSALGGTKGSLLDKYGGEYEFDNFSVILHDRRGSDNGVKIKYGKNLTDLNQNRDISAMYSGVYPFAKYTKTPDGLTFDEVTEEVTVTLSEKIIYSKNSSQFKTQNILIKDFTEYFIEQALENENDNTFGDNSEITEAQLREAVNAWIASNDFGNPKVSINLSYEDLSKSEEYKGKPVFDSVNLGDTVSVEYGDLGVSVTARVAKTKYDVLCGRFDAITVGSVRPTIADTIVGSTEKIETTKKELNNQNISNRAQLEQAIKKATELLNGANGGVWELLDENGDGINDAWVLRSYDNRKFVKATRDGIGVTVDGGKTYKTAITAEGIHGDAIIAHSVTAEQMNADGISAKNVNISGKIEAEEGNIAGFEIGEILHKKDEYIVQPTDSVRYKTEKETIIKPDEISVHEKYSREDVFDDPGYWNVVDDLKTSLSQGRLNVDFGNISGGDLPGIIHIKLSNNVYAVYLDLASMSLKVRKLEFGGEV
jgi:phage minor structural protein